MRKVIVTEWMTLDGVVQAPGAPDEDTAGGFEHGGWHLRYFDDVSQKWVLDNLTRWAATCSGAERTRGSRPTCRTRRGGASHRRTSEHEAEVCRVDQAHGAARVAELDGAPGGRRPGRARAEAGGRRRSAGARQAILATYTPGEG